MWNADCPISVYVVPVQILAGYFTTCRLNNLNQQLSGAAQSQYIDVYNDLIPIVKNIQESISKTTNSSE